MRVLVTGAAGRLGKAVLAAVSARGHDGIGVTRAELDITDFKATHAVVGAARPDVVIHTAAWTDVDGCAREPDKALLINGMGAQHVALAAAAAGAAILHISTNEVFDGLAGRAYREYDATQPANPYGYSKWTGERAVQAVNPRHYIARTSWLFAHGGRNFIQAILGAANAGKPLRVVVDEIANPTYTDDLAAAAAVLIESERYGIYHLVNEGWCSRYQFARTILDAAGYAETPITPIAGREWRAPPRRHPIRRCLTKRERWRV